MESLKKKLVEKSGRGGRLKEIDPGWLDDMGVKQLKDLDPYNRKSVGSDIWKAVKQEEVVGSAASEGSEALPDTAENTEGSDSDDDSSESDSKDS